MTNPNSVAGGIGAHVFPVAPGSDLDPAQTMFIGLFQAAINDELGAVWTQLWADKSALVDGTPVGSTLLTEPDLDNLRQAKQKWPVFALYRAGEPVADDFTLWQGRVTQSWRIEHVLGPLEIVSEMKARALLERERSLITRILADGGHRSYSAVTLQDGRRVPAAVFASAGISVVRSPRFQIGAASHAGSDTKYFCLGCSFETHELEQPESIGRDLAGVTVQVTSGNADGQIPNLMAFRTDVVPQQPDDGS